MYMVIYFLINGKKDYQNEREKERKSNTSDRLWDTFQNEEESVAFDLSEYLYLEIYKYIFIGTL